jgi:regulator of RNase E activity RraA
MIPSLTDTQLAEFEKLGTCAVANAIETFGVRLRNEGFTDASIRCLIPRPKPMVGYAMTARIKCSNPPKDGHAYVDRTDWWNYAQSISAPRVVVIQDVDEKPGTGSLVGEVHAGILMALGCSGVVTNGAVRDVPALEKAGFHVFAGSLAVSHAYAHIVEFGHARRALGAGRNCRADSRSRGENRRTREPRPRHLPFRQSLARRTPRRGEGREPLTPHRILLCPASPFASRISSSSSV